MPSLPSVYTEKLTPPRIWAKHQTLADPQHLGAARLLRRGRVEMLQPLAQTEVELRSLTDYDTALGITADLDDGAA